MKFITCYQEMVFRKMTMNAYCVSINGNMLLFVVILFAKCCF